MIPQDCEKISNPSLEGLLPLEKKLSELFTKKASKVILLAGPTCSGKTALSLSLAKLLGGEIISADSMQVYQGMNIGTAKVSREERTGIPHHLIDIRNVQDSFTVVDFYYEARKAIESIVARDRVPIVVGGTGFYFSTLIYGPPQGPPSMPEVRLRLEERLQQFGAEALYDRLEKIDPLYAKTITPNDQQKIIRALEIVLITGDKVSAHKWSRERPKNEYKFSPWFLHRPREVLYPMIDSRCESMLKAGFVEEVEALKKEGILYNRSARNAIGYKQCLEYLESDRSPEEYENFVKKFKQSCRNLAKRQFTWFRKEPLFHWLDLHACEEEIAVEMIAEKYLSN